MVHFFNFRILYLNVFKSNLFLDVRTIFVFRLLCSFITLCPSLYSVTFFFKYCLLAIRLEDTSVYNLICCLVVVSWKGDHPAMSPQSCRSEVQRVFSLS